MSPNDAAAITLGQLLTALAGCGDLAKPSIRAGWTYELMPLTFGRGRIVLTDGSFVEDAW
ncbi:MAG: hypothetical protein OXH66_08845 [Gemmatimonadetes bacterium]|nr:hypothetical protein [Gemmatimonadota bacterium]